MTGDFPRGNERKELVQTASMRQMSCVPYRGGYRLLWGRFKGRGSDPPGNGSTVVLKERGAPVKGQVCDRESCFHSLHRALFEVRTGSGQKKNNLEAVRRFQKSSHSHMTYMKMH